MSHGLPPRNKNPGGVSRAESSAAVSHRRDTSFVGTADEVTEGPDRSEPMMNTISGSHRGWMRSATTSGSPRSSASAAARWPRTGSCTPTWACLARRLGTEEGKVRDAAQQLIITEPQRFAVAHRSCAGCEEVAALLVLAEGP